MAVVKKQAFDLQAELKKALAFVVEDMERVRQESPDWHVGKYFTASDLESRVRAAAVEAAEGRPYGSLGTNNFLGMGRARIRLNRDRNTWNRTGLLGECRAFLAARVQAGELRADHPGGCRTSTGLRFRPADWPLTAAEEKAKALPEEERRRRGWIVHLQPGRAEHDWKPKREPLCFTPRRAAGGIWSYRRRPIRVTGDPAKVTCKQCKKLFARRAGLKADTPPEIVQDLLLEKGLLTLPKGGKPE
jgi:hypothetical protein